VKRAKAKAAHARLSRVQTGWLAALLLCAQFPLWPSVHPWVAVAGTGLAILRLLPPAQRFSSSKLRGLLLPALALIAAPVAGLIILVQVSLEYFQTCSCSLHQ